MEELISFLIFIFALGYAISSFLVANERSKNEKRKSALYKRKNN